MYFFHAVKNIQTQIHGSLNVALAAGITFGNVFRCNQNIVFKVVDTLDKFLFFREIIRHSVKKGNSRCPQCFCIENVNKVFAHDHGRCDQGSILRINFHLLCQNILGFSHRCLVPFHKLFFCDDLIFHLFLEDHIRDKITHKDHIFNIAVLQVKTLEIGQVIPDKFFHQLIIMDGRFFQFLKALTDS